MRSEKELEILDARCDNFRDDMVTEYRRAQELYFKTGHSGALTEYKLTLYHLLNGLKKTLKK